VEISKMSAMPGDAYLDPYRESATRHGANFGVTLWASELSQQLRFDVFTQMCYLPGKRLLDAGCSRGDLAAYLIDQQIDFGSYVGVDALPNVIDFARERKLPQCEFVCGDFLSNGALMKQGSPQVVMISGSLNTMGDAEAFRVLENAWSATCETLLFNFLSDTCGPQAPLQDQFARRLSTLGLLEWAMKKTAYVAFRQDYFPAGHDATIMMRRK